MISHKYKIGLIINPIAGIGGKVALKGSDGIIAVTEALSKGAVPEANIKAERAMKSLLLYKENIIIYTVSGNMGGYLCQKLRLKHKVLYTPPCKTTSRLDTINAAKAIASASVDLLLFVGGDGTARDICEAIADKILVLGIPAGVKIQSAVFALAPEAAGSIIANFIQFASMESSLREVVDLDEDAYRIGHISSKLYGVMKVPGQTKQLQSMKQGGFISSNMQIDGIALYLKDHMECDTYYAVGSGSSAKCISRKLGIDYELLGIDIIYNFKLVAKDVTEQQLWRYAQGGNLKIIVSPIGGQGFIFGRGNPQFSARVLYTVGKSNIQVISPIDKLLSIRDHTLHVDCGDVKVDKLLRGYYRILCDYSYFVQLLCK